MAEEKMAEEDFLAQLAALGQADQYAADMVEQEKQRALRTDVGVPSALARPAPEKVRLTQIPSRILEGMGRAYGRGAQEVARGFDDALTQYGSGLPTQVDPNAVVQIPGMSVNLPGAPLPTVIPPRAQQPAQPQQKAVPTPAPEKAEDDKKPTKTEVADAVGGRTKLPPAPTRASMSLSTRTAPKTEVKSAYDTYLEANKLAEQGYKEARDYESLEKLQAKAALADAKEKLGEADDMQGRFRFDPGRAMPTLGSKIAAGIAIALGAAAQGLRGGGGSNIGLDMINKMIDREMQTQQQQYNQLGDRVKTASNLYARNLKILGDEKAAEFKTKQIIINEAKSKIDTLLKKAGQEQLNMRLQAQLDQQMRALSMKASASMMSGGRGKPATFEQARATKDDLFRANSALDNIRQAKFSISNVAELGPILAKLVNEENILGDLTGISGSSFREKFLRLTNAALQQTDAEGRRPFINEFLNVIGTEVSSDYANLDAYQKMIQMLAFSMASAGQSSSSISNRDVQMFVDVLGASSTNPSILVGYVRHLEEKAMFDKAMAEYLMTPQPTLGGQTGLQAGMRYDDALTHVANLPQYKAYMDGGKFETSFIRQLQDGTYKLPEQLRNSMLSGYTIDG